MEPGATTPRVRRSGRAHSDASRDPGSPPWHALAPEATLAAVDSRADGLTSAEAERRLATVGPNEPVVERERSAWRLLAEQYRGTVTLLLVGAAGAAVWMGQASDVAAIAVVLLLNGLLGFATEYRARGALAALKRLGAPRAIALRDGRPTTLEARSIVPGDVVLLESGDAVPADVRLLDAAELTCGEATLTGESEAVAKDPRAVLAATAPLPDRRTMAYAGTAVMTGTARAVVVATGARTELGSIGRLMRDVEPRATPLERRLEGLGRAVAVAAVGAGALVAVRELFLGGSLALVIETGLAVAVAAVPEGLPAVVTITAALATRRMARRNAIVRRLAAVEALGSTTVVCTDKTGTLTAGAHSITTTWLLDGGAAEHPPHGDRSASRIALVEAGRRASASAADPTDLAFIAAAVADERERPAVETVIPFSSERRFAAVVRSVDGRREATIKGAASAVLPRCASLATASGTVALDAGHHDAVRGAESELAARGLRVIAVAAGTVASDAEAAIGGLTLLGLVGLEDPMAAGAAETIGTLRAAGIRTLMLTGDHASTARTIARHAGLGSGTVIEAAAIEALDDAALDARVGDLAVVARVSPAAKLRVIESLQRRGEIVAMLGDGVNDAPALRRADIGVAMGRRGTAVAREAADLVLADDRLATVAAAVEEGRVVYDNVRRFVFFLFSCNLAEIAVLLGSSMLGLPLPLTPLQILWLNLITDTLPALALAVEPSEPGVMSRPPRAPDAPLLTGALIARTLAFATLIAAVSLAAFAWHVAGDGDHRAAGTMAFTTLAIAQLFHVGNARRRDDALSARSALANLPAVAAVAVCLALQTATVAFAPLGRVLGTRPLTAAQWAVCVALALVPAIAGQLWRAVQRTRRAG